MNTVSFGMQMSAAGIMGLLLAFLATFVCRAASAKDMFSLMRKPAIWLLGFGMLVFMFIETGVLGTYYNIYLWMSTGSATRGQRLSSPSGRR